MKTYGRMDVEIRALVRVQLAASHPGRFITLEKSQLPVGYEARWTPRDGLDGGDSKSDPSDSKPMTGHYTD
jgi:hypothetical protein